MLHVSLGIIVFNEEKNILNMLQSVSSQKLERVAIGEVIVVSSGSVDKTADLVLAYSQKDRTVSLVVQERREGKASAINEFLSRCRNQIVIVTSGDVIFDENTVESLLSPFLTDEGIGMSSAKPVPIDGARDFMGFVSTLHWKLHRLLKRNGETIAFRKNLVNLIPTVVSADEAYIEAIVQQRGYRIGHPDNAMILNKGPKSVTEFLRQIRRHYAGHLFVRAKFSYTVSSMTIRGIVSITKELLRCLSDNLDRIHYIVGYVLMETAGRFLGIWDFYIRKRHYSIWSIAETTKDLNEISS